MEEQLSQRQLKSIHRMAAFYERAFIVSLLLIVSKVLANNFLPDVGFYVSLSGYALSCCLWGQFSYAKNKNREKIIINSLFIISLIDVIPVLYYILFASIGLIGSINDVLLTAIRFLSIYTAWMLLQKTKGIYTSKNYKPLFIVYFILPIAYFCVPLFAYLQTPNANPFQLLLYFIAYNLWPLILTLLNLILIYLKYKSLTSQTFYQYLIVSNPNVIKIMYQSSKRKSNKNSSLNCQNCGISVRPGDRFCKKCGSPLASPSPAASPSDNTKQK